jgi:hypothetical protein
MGLDELKANFSFLAGTCFPYPNGTAVFDRIPTRLVRMIATTCPLRFVLIRIRMPSVEKSTASALYPTLHPSASATSVICILSGIRLIRRASG